MSEKAGKLKVLVVDDREENLDVARRALNNPDMEFTFTSSASEAIEKIAGHDIILTDFLFRGEDPKIHETYLSGYVGGLEIPEEIARVGDRKTFERMLERNRQALTDGRTTYEDIVRAAKGLIWNYDDPPNLGEIVKELELLVDDREYLPVKKRLGGYVDPQEALDMAGKALDRNNTRTEYGYGGLSC